MDKPIIIIAGPTASGKTSLAITLAKKFNGEIVNADSRSIYREMDIATSKPTAEERKQIPHHLVDVISPNEPFSLSDYKQLAIKAISNIHARDKIPFFVGGTGLYLDAVVYDYSLTNVESDFTLRKKLETIDIEVLAAELKSIDPATYQSIDLNNKRRLIRAIEVSKMSKVSYISLQSKKQKPSNMLYLVLDVPRNVLYEKINQRIDMWHDNGLIDETEKLNAKYSASLSSMSAIGYREITEYLNHNISLIEALEIMKKRTRNYAKRQLTWFRKNPDVVYISKSQEAVEIIKTFLKLN